MATTTATIDDQEFQGWFARFVQSLNTRPQRIAQGLSNAAELVLMRAKAYYLTGGALNVQTGRLRSSVTKQPDYGAHRTGDIYHVDVGSNVWYGRRWELGGTYQEAVKAHTRRISKAFGRPIMSKVISISAHTRSMSYDPPRKWLEPAVRDETPSAIRILEKAGAIFL